MFKKMFIKINFMLILLFMFPFFVKAECNYQRKSDLSKIASNVQISYTYSVKQGEEPIFFVTVSNLTNDIYALDNYENTLSFSGEGTFQYNSGSTIKYTFFSNDPNCMGEKVMTKYLKLPYFNPNYNTKECNENPGFKYCKLWDYNVVSSDVFDSELKKYINEKNNTNNSSSSEEKFNINSYIIYICIIIVSFLILIMIVRKRNKM